MKKARPVSMLLKQTFTIIFFSFLGGIAMLAGTNCSAGSGPNLQEGLWEVISKMEMMGMKMPAIKHNQCISKNNAVPESSQQGQRCKMINTTVKGDTVKWNMICESSEGKSEMNGEITYHGDTFEGVLRINTQGMEMNQNMSGRRIGKCK